jgi:deazaflavin-dependent oxidoreductase (nitroreductase family)
VLQRVLLKMPPLIYRGPLAELLKSRCVMLLTTRGRKSGLRRTTAISFMPLGDRLIVFSGWGRSSNWYRNVQADPEVEVQVGRRRMRATARLVPDPEERKRLMLQMQGRSSGCGPPGPMRPVLKRLGIFDYEGEITMAVAQGGDLPVLEVVPHG